MIISAGLFLVALLGVLYLFYHQKKAFGPFNLRVYGLTIVVGFTILISLADLSPERLTPCYAILSAFAGYLFGIKDEKEKNSSNSPNKD